MSDSFDAYHQWLGIPPSEQPADHYRLLGITRFESNAEVIANALDRQMAHVRTFQTGRRASVCQQLLNEISAAGIFLLDPDKKATYDETLREPPQAEPDSKPAADLIRIQKPAGTTDSQEKSPDSADWTQAIKTASASTPHTRLIQRKKQSRAGLVVWAASAVALLGLLGTVFLLLASDVSLKPTTGSPKQRQTTGDQKLPDAVTITQDPVSLGLDFGPEGRDPAQPPPETLAPPSSPEPSAVKLPQTEPDDLLEKKPETTPSPATGYAGVPDEEAQQALLEQLHSVYEKDFAEATSRESKGALAKLLLEQARQMADETDSRFVLLSEARRLAIAAGDGQLASRVVDTVIDHYRVDKLDWRSQLLLDRAERATTATQRSELAAAAVHLSQIAIQRQRLPVAETLIRMARRQADRKGEVDLRKRVLAAEKEIANLKRESNRLKRFQQTLADNPDDPQANLGVGKHLCLRKGDWDQGLPLLAKCGDEQLRKAARLELTKPSDPAAQVALAEEWFDYGEKHESETAWFLRARHWYTIARPGSKGLVKVKLESRLQRLDELARSEIAGDDSAAPPASAKMKIVIRNRRTLRGHTNAVTAVAISADGSLLASGGNDRHVILRYLVNRNRAWLTGHTQPVVSVAFSPDGKTLASGSRDATIILWDVASRRKRGLLVGHTDAVTCIAFSPDGRMLASASNDTTIRLWNLGTGQSQTLTGHKAETSCVAFSPDGTKLVSGSHDGMVKVWNPKKGRARKTIRASDRKVMSVAYLSDEKTIATAGSSKEFALWNAASGKQIATFQAQGQWVSNVQFTPDGTIMISCGDHAMELWDVKRHRRLQAFPKAHSDIINVLAISADGKQVASGSSDTTVVLWELDRRAAGTDSNESARSGDNAGKMPGLIGRVKVD